MPSQKFKNYKTKKKMLFFILASTPEIGRYGRYFKLVRNIDISILVHTGQYGRYRYGIDHLGWMSIFLLIGSYRIQ